MPPFRLVLRFLKHTGPQSKPRRRRTRSTALQSPEILESRELLSAENIIIQDDFESGMPAPAWDLVLSSDNSDGVVSGIAHSGSHSFKINYSYDEDQGKLEKYNIPPGEEIYVRYWQMYPEAFDQRNLKQSYLFNYDETVGLQGNITLSLWGPTVLETSNPQMMTSFYGGSDSDGSGGVEDGVRASYDDFSVPAGEWFRTAFYAKWNTPGQSDGVYKLWRNDVLIVDLNDVKYRTTEKTPDSLWIGGNYSGAGTDPIPFDRYIDDILVAHTPADDPELNPAGPESFDANGTAGSDAFVLTYSGNSADSTVNVSVSSNGAAARNLGTFPISTVINVNGFGGTDSVRIVGSNLNDTLEVSSTGLLINNSRVVLNSVENRTLSGGGGGDNYLFDTDANLGTYLLSELATADGIDSIDFSRTGNVDVTLNLGTTAEQVVNQNLSIRLNSPTAFENLVGGNRNDTLTGNSRSNRLIGNAGNDILNGGSGSDALFGGPGNDSYIFGGVAADGELDSIGEAGGAGVDSLDFSSLSANVTIDLSNSAAPQQVHVKRRIKLASGFGIERVIGGAGHDRLMGNTLANVLIGNAGNDTLNGGPGSDALFGGIGDDTYVFGGVASGVELDSIAEAANTGIDTLDFSGLRASVTVDISNSAEQQQVHVKRRIKLASGLGIDNVIGGAGNDRLTGNALGNVLVGQAGNDQLHGNGGRDILIGGVGLDNLAGGIGEDILIAGRTVHDTNAENLTTLLAGWNASTTYASRVSALRLGVGTPKVSLIRRSTVLNDSGQRDILTGGTSNDWFFRAVDDVITDLVAGELSDSL